MLVGRGCTRPIAAVRHRFASYKVKTEPLPAAEAVRKFPSIRLYERYVPAARDDDDFSESSRFKRYLVFYDGTCYFCHSGVRWLIKNDKHERIRFSCMQSNLYKQFAMGVIPEEISQTVVVVDECANTCFQGFPAILKLLSVLPKPYSKWGTFLSFLPESVLDYNYRNLVRLGHDWFGKGQDEILVLKERELLDRFIGQPELMKLMKQRNSLVKKQSESGFSTTSDTYPFYLPFR